MSLRLNVGINKKVGQPNYGSLGASCHVEVELDQSLVFDDVEEFHDRVTHAYAACRQAVQDELAWQSCPGSQPSTSDPTSSPADEDGQNGLNGHPATQKQLDYVQLLAGQIPGMSAENLEKLAQILFEKALANLASLEASRLIDRLKEIKAGCAGDSKR